MSDSALTKKAIADGFKAVMDKKSFEKITISDITDYCGLNRQTFYYHFQDKYELLNWILSTEIISVFADNLSMENWNDKLLLILYIVKDNARFYSNAFNTAHGDEFRRYLFEAIVNVLCDVIDQITDHQPISDEDKRFIAEFLSYGISGCVSKWVHTGMKQSPEATAKFLKELVNGFKEFICSRYFPKIDPHQIF